MSADLTVDNLCAAIRHFLMEAAGDRPPPHAQHYTLVLNGVPADDTMKAVMEMLGGVLRIEVRELPAEVGDGLKESALPPQGSIPFGHGANLWSPKEPINR